ncbi:hypothetical protein ASG22_16950 [Chryseobacterium sp. Leaf405]|uniref:hypothetical protein n=1 Tax=Chryseobacterium sp. Leaf405 TaxID=1736367 RepID=UPI000701AC55|nr:hypothetical protein [Chryseobacterium sp. Leaf405]KQT20662.1 hypothetical protein ASG22_16950 [Chryseobacterium sp. Leaf405]
MMKKNYYLLLFAVVLLLFGCRTEDLSEKDNPVNLTGSSSQFISRKVSPIEFQKINGLNEKFSKNESLLSQKISTGKNILDGAVIDSAYAMETTDGNVISYTFPVYRNNQKDIFENLVLQRKVGEQNFKSYLYQYHRIGANSYNKKNIEVFNLDFIDTTSSGKMMFTTISSTDGCIEIQATTVDCGEGGHHTNGAYCPSLGYHVPFDYITSFNNCPAGGGGGGGGGNTNPGNNNPSPGGNNNGDYGVTIPVPNYPKWGMCRERTGMHWDALDLNSNQLAFINASEQNALRGEMTRFLTNNEVFTFDCNAPREVSPDVKSVGLWIVNYAMTNPDFLNSEFWTDFVNSDLQFQQWAMNFLNQNSNVSLDELLFNRYSSEPNASIDFNDNESGNYDETDFEDFNFENQQTQWSTVNNVIPVSDFVGWNAPGIRKNCMDYAKAQIAKKGYKISNYYDVDSQGNKQTFQIYTEQNGVNLNDLYKGVSYIKYALSHGIPVIVGIDDAVGGPGNIDGSTNHFVVIVGMGTDSKGNFFRFYDNASGTDPINQGANPENKLYYKYPERIFTGKTYCTAYRAGTEYDYIITMIRKSK